MNTAQLIDGKQVAAEIIQEIKQAVSTLQGRPPSLAFILVGDNPASKSYVQSKQKACATTGIRSILITFPNSIAEQDLLFQIEQLNRDTSIDGILVQLPLPSHIREQIITLAIDPAKDVDGFHPINVGKMLIGDESARLPCTPHGIQVLLEKNKIPVHGKHVVIVGRSNIVGKPLAALFMQKKQGANATVTVCHSQSEHLYSIMRSADILIAAIGKAHFVRPNMVKQGAVVIDVGINRINGMIQGDVEFDTVRQVASYITPVPGGVGPMTIAMLMKNTLLSYNHS